MEIKELTCLSGKTIEILRYEINTGKEPTFIGYLKIKLSNEPVCAEIFLHHLRINKPVGATINYVTDLNWGENYFVVKFTHDSRRVCHVVIYFRIIEQHRIGEYDDRHIAREENQGEKDSNVYALLPYLFPKRKKHAATARRII